MISIHALRAEGDPPRPWPRRPPPISIHALRAEGDAITPAQWDALQCISIHALRAEGDA